MCLNVRRTDFLKSDVLNATDRNWFFAAADKMAAGLTAPKIFIFSDDPQWCRDHLDLPYAHRVVGHEHRGQRFGNYMQLMTRCRHFVIPNSSFAWWATWLADYENKRVIAPRNWFAAGDYDTRDVLPAGWEAM